MSPKRMKLPKAGKSVFSSRLRIHKEWVTDPSPLMAQRLTKDVLRRIQKTKLEGLTKIKVLEKKIDQINTSVTRKIEGMISRRR